MKKYIRPVSKVVQIDDLCDQNFNNASVFDKQTVVDNISVVENKDPNNTDNSDDRSWGSDTWGGD